MYHIVLLVLAEPSNRKTILSVCQTNQSFQGLLWDALQATGVVPERQTKETITKCHPNQQRAAIEQGLTALATTPPLRCQLDESPGSSRVALERLVGLFHCMKLFQPMWLRAVEVSRRSFEMDGDGDSSSSLQGMVVVSGGSDSGGKGTHHDTRPMDQIELELDDSEPVQWPRLSDGSDSSKDSLAFSESDGSQSIQGGSPSV